MFFRSKKPEWLVVFLGNPGQKYEGTRHNVGFLAAELLEKSEHVKIKRLKYRALTAVCCLGGVPVMLIKPQTYMNLSGESVAPAAAFYKIPSGNILVVADDVSLSPGDLRIRRRGSAGGHNGLKSIIKVLGNDDFPRVKIGIGTPDYPDYDMADWVTGKLRGNDLAKVETAAAAAAEAVKIVVSGDIDRAMNQYN